MVRYITEQRKKKWLSYYYTQAAIAAISCGELSECPVVAESDGGRLKHPDNMKYFVFADYLLLSKPSGLSVLHNISKPNFQFCTGYR